MACFLTTLSADDQSAGPSDAEAEAIKFFGGRHIDASLSYNAAGEVVAVNIRCTHGLWDNPQPYDKSNWLPEFGEHLRAFEKLQEVKISGWCYSDDDIRHLADIPHLTSFGYDTAFGNAEPLNGSGLKHLVMRAELRELRLFGLGADGVTDDSLRHVGRLTSLRKLNLYSQNLTDEGLRHLAPLNLHEFKLYTKRVTGEGFAHLAHMRGMRMLTLQHNEIEDEGLSHLADMPELQELDLQYNHITDAGLRHLANLTELRKLLLSGNEITGEGTRQLSKLHRLELLTLHGNERLADAALPPLMDLPALGTLTLGETEVTIDALRRFRKRRPEVQLSFRANRAYGLGDHWHVKIDDQWRIRRVSFNNATDEDLAKFTSMPALADVEYLSMPFPQRITGKGLAHLQSHKNITTLHLDECHIGDEGLQAIGQLKQLEHLQIDEGNITGEGLSHLAGLTELRSLAITNNDLTDDDLAFLRGMTELEHVNLAGNRISAEAAARYLRDAKQLTRLNLSSDTFRGDRVITAEALRRLQQASVPLPD